MPGKKEKQQGKATKPVAPKRGRASMMITGDFLEKLATQGKDTVLKTVSHLPADASFVGAWFMPNRNGFMVVWESAHWPQTKAGGRLPELLPLQAVVLKVESKDGKLSLVAMGESEHAKSKT